jgi:hypothetical protein
VSLIKTSREDVSTVLGRHNHELRLIASTGSLALIPLMQEMEAAVSDKPALLYELAGIWSYLDIAKAQRMVQQADSADPEAVISSGHHGVLLERGYQHYILNLALEHPREAAAHLIATGGRVGEHWASSAARGILQKLATQNGESAKLFASAYGEPSLEKELHIYLTYLNFSQPSDAQILPTLISGDVTEVYNLGSSELLSEAACLLAKEDTRLAIGFIAIIERISDRIEAYVSVAAQIRDSDTHGALTFLRLAQGLAMAHEEVRYPRTLFSIANVKPKGAEWSSFKMIGSP